MGVKKESQKFIKDQRLVAGKSLCQEKQNVWYLTKDWMYEKKIVVMSYTQEEKSKNLICTIPPLLDLEMSKNLKEM